MNQETLAKDLRMLEDMVACCSRGTNCFLHMSRVRERAENGFYHGGKECDLTTPPNMRGGKCCGTCRHSECNVDYVCIKFNGFVSPDQVCDDWEEV